MRPMRDEPQLLVPVSEAEKQQAPTPAPVPRWVVVLTRLWIVIACFFAWMVFNNGGGALQFRGAVLTIGGFAAFWLVAMWICGVKLPPDDKQR